MGDCAGPFVNGAAGDEYARPTIGELACNAVGRAAITAAAQGFMTAFPDMVVHGPARGAWYARRISLDSRRDKCRARRNRSRGPDQWSGTVADRRRWIDRGLQGSL